MAAIRGAATATEAAAESLLDTIARKAYSAKKQIEQGRGFPQVGTFAELGALCQALELRLAMAEAARGKS